MIGRLDDWMIDEALMTGDLAIEVNDQHVTAS
jgi:hypothetical protein